MPQYRGKTRLYAAGKTRYNKNIVEMSIGSIYEEEINLDMGSGWLSFVGGMYLFSGQICL